MGRALHVLALLLVSFPVVAVGQERVPQVQIKTAADDVPQSISATIERPAVSVAVIRTIGEELDPRLWNVDMGGVNPFRIPEPPIHLFHAFSPDALIGPVWNHGVAGKQYWDRQGMVNPARNSITILEGNSKDIEISVSEQPSSDVTVVITGHAGTDLTVSPSTLTFTASDWADKTATLTAGHDDDKVNDEITLTITTTEGTDESSVQRAVTIMDDEIIWELTPLEIWEGTGSGVYIPLLETLGPPSGDVAFTITGQGTRLIPNPSTLTFPADDWQRNQWLGLVSRVDQDDKDERVILTFTAAGGGYDGLTYSLEITIKDRPALESSIPEGSSITIGFNLVSVNDRPQSDLIATYSGYEGTDLTVSPSTVTYTADSWFGPCVSGSRIWNYCSSKRTVTVAAAHDADDEDDQEILIFEITGPESEPRWFGLSRRENIRIEDDDGPALVVSPLSLGIPEGKTRSFSVRLSQAPLGNIGNIDVIVRVPQSQGDLTASPSSLTFTSTNWDQGQDVRLTAGHDANIEDDMEEITVTASGGGFDGAKASVSVTILDDDEPGLRIYPMRVSVTEGGDWATIYVALASVARPTGEVTVRFPPFTDPALQHNRLRSPMTFTPSDYRRSQALVVWAEEDADAVSEFESIKVTASGGGYDGVTHPLWVSVTDNDVAGPRLEVDPTSVSVDEDSTAEFTVRLSTEPSGEVTVRIPSFTDPALRRSPSTLTFTRSNHRVAQMVTVSAAEDANTVNESESIRLTASGGGYDGATRSVTVTVTDNDVAGARLEVDPISVPIDEGSTAEFTVKLATEPAGEVTVQIPPFTDPALRRSPSALTFTRSSHRVAQTVTVAATEDANMVNESESIRLTASGGGYDGAAQAVTVSVTDNDIVVPRLEVDPTSVSLDEGTSAEFTVKLSAEPAGEVTVRIPPFTDPALHRSPSMLTFTASTWDAPQTVTVSAAEDANAVDESESIQLTASGGGYGGATHDGDCHGH